MAVEDVRGEVLLLCACVPLRFHVNKGSGGNGCEVRRGSPLHDGIIVACKSSILYEEKYADFPIRPLFLFVLKDLPTSS